VQDKTTAGTCCHVQITLRYRAPDWKGAFERARGRVSVIAGAADELMDAAAYERALPPLGAPVTIVPGVDHMGIVSRPEAIKAILAAFAE
jgi:pimeloyl-ACP methyl ester carboxylesterase